MSPGKKVLIKRVGAHNPIRKSKVRRVKCGCLAKTDISFLNNF